mmetsp:Transcript_2517/g.3700  ORF Transcript_2517/g.3700 Transcript_2517/m.3700 type:complete len:156 (-) Transcript_2517:113-580(-)
MSNSNTNRTNLGDEPLAKRHCTRLEEKPFAESNHKTGDKVYIGNLDPRIGTSHLEKLMQPYGVVTDVSLCYNKNNSGDHHKPSGFGFCQFSSPNEALTAIESLHGRTLLGRTLKVSYANEKQNTLMHKPKKGTKIESIDEKIRKLRSAIDDDKKI